MSSVQASGASSGPSSQGLQEWILQLERRVAELELWRVNLERGARRRRLYWLLAIAAYVLLTYLTLSSLDL